MFPSGWLIHLGQIHEHFSHTPVYEVAFRLVLDLAKQLQVQLIFKELLVISAHSFDVKGSAIVQNLTLFVKEVHTSEWRIEASRILHLKVGMVHALGPLKRRRYYWDIRWNHLLKDSK